MPEYTGNIHIHSIHSDGSEGIDKIAEAAQKSNLDFLYITDHGTLAGQAGGSRWWGKTLVLVGSEINRECNHYLALGIKQEIAGNDSNPQKVIDAVREQGGIGIIAHPCERSNPLFNQGKHFPWKDWNVTGFNGIEVWNCASQWREQVRSYIHGFLCYHFNPLGPLTGADPAALEHFDRHCRKEPVVMVCGSDAHALRLRRGILRGTFFPYEFHFRVLNTHLILPSELPASASEAEAALLQGLRNGNHFIALDGLARANGFTCSAFNKDTEVGMGGRLKFTPGATLKIHVPRPEALIRIIKGGRSVHQFKGSRLAFKVLSPGIFRVEVLLKRRGRYRPWIYGNPIYFEQ